MSRRDTFLGRQKQRGYIMNPYRFGGGAGADPYFSSVVQLAHFDGTNGSTTFTNSCPRGNTLSAVASAALSTSQSKWGGASLRISGNSTMVAKGAQNDDYEFSNADFTWEFWVRFDNITSTQDVFATFDGGALLRLINPGQLLYRVDSTTRITSATNAVSATTWHFLSLSRVSNVFSLAVDGVSVGSWSNSWDFGTATGELYVGNSGFDVSLVGYIDDLRVTKGVGRYTTATFTPPTEAFPDS